MNNTLYQPISLPYPKKMDMKNLKMTNNAHENSGKPTIALITIVGNLISVYNDEGEITIEKEVKQTVLYSQDFIFVIFQKYSRKYKVEIYEHRFTLFETQYIESKNYTHVFNGKKYYYPLVIHPLNYENLCFQTRMKMNMKIFKFSVFKFS